MSINSNDELLIQCDHVKKSFYIKGREIPVLKDINIKVKKGTVSIITGRSGMGKSTLIGLMGGLEPPTSGEINFDSHRLESMNSAKLAMFRRTRIGIIFQNFNLIPSWNAFENVDAALIHSGLSKKERAEKVTETLAYLGLSERVANLPSELSAGQQQRVAIARAIINKPSLILADEPTGDVDPETALEIVRILSDLVIENHLTMIVATHGTFPIHIQNDTYRLHEGILEKIS